MDKENRIYGLYYQLSPAHWGHGYASEAAYAIMHNVLINYPNATITAEAVCDNPASSSLLKKLGFKQTYIEEKGFKRNENGLQHKI